MTWHFQCLGLWQHHFIRQTGKTWLPLQNAPRSFGIPWLAVWMSSVVFCFTNLKLKTIRFILHWSSLSIAFLINYSWCRMVLSDLGGGCFWCIGLCPWDFVCLVMFHGRCQNFFHSICLFCTLVFHMFLCTCSHNLRFHMSIFLVCFEWCLCLFSGR